MRYLLILFLLVASPSAAFAADAPAAAELTRLLMEFLAGAGRNDAVVHERFWADDLIYTGSVGRRIGKSDILKGIRSAPPPKAGDPAVTYGAEEIRIQQYGDVAVVAFRLTAKGDGHLSNYLNSGTFLKRDGKWQVVNWQS